VSDCLVKESHVLPGPIRRWGNVASCANGGAEAGGVTSPGQNRLDFKSGV
jgi:hypothetical protein